MQRQHIQKSHHYSELTEIEKMERIRCIKCNRQPKSTSTSDFFNIYICHCGNVFWGLKFCPNCQKPQLTVVHHKPKMGQLIKCQNCHLQMHLFKCPYNNQHLFYRKKGQYRMGEVMQCNICEEKFKLLVCQCGGQTYLTPDKKIIQGYSPTTCKQCARQYYFINCSQCGESDYFADKLDFGEKILCSYCKKRRLYVPCPNCNRSIDTLKFYYGQTSTCNFCYTVFEYDNCPLGCGINYFLKPHIPGPIKKCQSQFCKGALYLPLNCHRCSNVLTIEELAPNYAQILLCPSCHNQLKYCYCITCKNVTLGDIKCSSGNCPPIPDKNILSSIPTNQQLPQNQSYSQSQCKICYDAPSCMVNTSCWHIMMCEKCFEDYKNKNGRRSQILPCPVCKVIGIFVKFKKPIMC